MPLLIIGFFFLYFLSCSPFRIPSLFPDSQSSTDKRLSLMAYAYSSDSTSVVKLDGRTLKSEWSSVSLPLERCTSLPLSIQICVEKNERDECQKTETLNPQTHSNRFKVWKIEGDLLKSMLNDVVDSNKASKDAQAQYDAIKDAQKSSSPYGLAFGIENATSQFLNKAQVLTCFQDAYPKKNTKIPTEKETVSVNAETRDPKKLNQKQGWAFLLSVIPNNHHCHELLSKKENQDKILKILPSRTGLIEEDMAKAYDLLTSDTNFINNLTGVDYNDLFVFLKSDGCICYPPLVSCQ